MLVEVVPEDGTPMAVSGWNSVNLSERVSVLLQLVSVSLLVELVADSPLVEVVQLCWRTSCHWSE